MSKEIFQGKFKSSKRLILEEFLQGEEASYFLIIDKKNFSFLVPHKITKELDMERLVLTPEEWELFSSSDYFKISRKK